MKMRRILLLVTLLGVGLASIVGAWSYAKHLDAFQLRKYLGQVNRPLYKEIKKTIQENDIDMVQAVPSNTPRIRLLLSKNDVAHFTVLYDKFKDPNYGVPYYAKQNKWRKATLVFNDEPYAIKIKAHGKNPTGHKVGKFMSCANRCRPLQPDRICRSRGCRPHENWPGYKSHAWKHP